MVYGNDLPCSQKSWVPVPALPLIAGCGILGKRLRRHRELSFPRGEWGSSVPQARGPRRGLSALPSAVFGTVSDPRPLCMRATTTYIKAMMTPIMSVVKGLSQELNVMTCDKGPGTMPVLSSAGENTTIHV